MGSVRRKISGCSQSLVQHQTPKQPNAALSVSNRRSTSGSRTFCQAGICTSPDCRAKRDAYKPCEIFRDPTVSMISTIFGSGLKVTYVGHRVTLCR